MSASDLASGSASLSQIVEGVAVHYTMQYYTATVMFLP